MLNYQRVASVTNPLRPLHENCHGGKSLPSIHVNSGAALGHVGTMSALKIAIQNQGGQSEFRAASPTPYTIDQWRSCQACRTRHTLVGDENTNQYIGKSRSQPTSIIEGTTYGLEQSQPIVIGCYRAHLPICRCFFFFFSQVIAMFLATWE